MGNGFTGKDLRAEFEACFTPDQKLADETGALIAALEAKDVATIKSIVTSFEQEALDDESPCKVAPYTAVDDAYYDQQDLVEAAMADPDWQMKAAKAIIPHRKQIKSLISDALTKFDAGDYYGSGQAVGQIDKMVFKPWEKNSFLQ